MDSSALPLNRAQRDLDAVKAAVDAVMAPFEPTSPPLTAEEEASFAANRPSFTVYCPPWGAEMSAEVHQRFRIDRCPLCSPQRRRPAPDVVYQLPPSTLDDVHPRCRVHGHVVVEIACDGVVLRVHDDGAAFGESAGFRRPVRFAVARDGGLRTCKRGDRRRRALARFKPMVDAFDVLGRFVEQVPGERWRIGVVEQDRRGRPPGYGVTDDDRDKITRLMAERIAADWRRLDAAYDVAAVTGWSSTTVLRVWRSRDQRRDQ